MKLQLFLGVIMLVMPLHNNSGGHQFEPCNDKVLSRALSPNGKLVLTTYHRECKWNVLTVAAVQKPAGRISSSGEAVCYLTSWDGRHPVEAVWKADDTILISTTDRLERLEFGDSKESCAGIKVNYSVQFRNERQQTNDPEVISKIRKTLSEVGPCIDSFYKAAYPTNDPSGEVNKLVDRGEHRSSVELLLGYTADAGCALSPATYDTIGELSDTFDLKPSYVESVKRLVMR
jgi:hypothetical protein